MEGIARQLCFHIKNYLSDGRVKETVATVKKITDLWNPGAMDGFSPFVMNCTCMWLLNVVV